jgi:carboxyl-terminal processing protease
MRNFTRKVKINSLLLVIVAGIIVLSLGFRNAGNKDFQLTRNMDIFFSMIREIGLFYVDEVNPEKLIENAIAGVMQGLDPYTTYVPESEKDNYASMTTGRYGGIGAMIRQADDYVVIADPYENFPAQKAGLRAGDVITMINGKSTKGLRVNEVSELLKGPPNSKLEITVNRLLEKEPVKKEIVREEVKIRNVPWYGKVSKDIGYIQFSGFTENAHQEVKEAVIDLKSNHGATKIIIDVRDNPGGLLIEAVNVTNLFVDKGQEIVSTKGKVEQWDHTYRARHRPLDTSLPVVILVGRGSASASEIVAGALQDLDRGIIIGQRTFGKGLIQTTRQLSYNAQLKITTAKYYTPSGRCIQALDFSDETGAVTIHDSLINEFTTKNGRKVYDGGGIIPDIQIPLERISPLVANLYARNLIFDYATEYAARNPSIPPVNQFRINDNEYLDFIEFTERKGFGYQTRTESQLEQLIKTAREEQYYEISMTAFNELSEKLGIDKSKDFENHSREIRSLLREEIAGRYYFQKGRIEASLDGDPALEKAIEILNNTSLYHSILSGSTSYAGR